MRDECRVYNKVVIDMETEEILEEDSFWYSGPLALCQEGEGEGEGGEGEEGGEDLGEGEEGEYSEGEEGEEGEEGDDDLEGLTPKEMMEQIRNLQTQIAEISPGKQEGQEASGEEGPSFQEIPVIQDDDSLDDALSSSEKFNNTLNQAFQQFGEQMMKSLPKVVQNMVAQQQAMQETARQFYTSNPDLAEYKSFVGKVSEKLSSDHPDWGMDKVLEETSKEARRRLNLKQQTQKTKGKNPGFPKKPSSGKRTTKTKPDPKQSQIDEMNKALGGT